MGKNLVQYPGPRVPGAQGRLNLNRPSGLLEGGGKRQGARAMEGRRLGRPAEGGGRAKRPQREARLEAQTCALCSQRQASQEAGPRVLPWAAVFTWKQEHELLGVSAFPIVHAARHAASLLSRPSAVPAGPKVASLNP